MVVEEAGCCQESAALGATCVWTGRQQARAGESLDDCSVRLVMTGQVLGGVDAGGDSKKEL